MPNFRTIAYSQQDIDIIINHVKDCPTNLQEAFTRASRDIGRNAPSISAMWYQKIKKMYAATIIGSEKGMMVNTKNVLRKTTTQSEHLSIIGLCINKISKDEKKQLINLLISHL